VDLAVERLGGDVLSVELYRRRRRSHAALALVACAASACGRLSASGDGGSAFVPPGDAELADPPPTLPTLLSAAAGPGLARLAWFPASADAPELELALFSAPDAQALDAAIAAGIPYAGPLTGSALTLAGLADGVELAFALAVRPIGATTWTASGARLRLRPGSVIYVRAGADPAIADGLTPASAFPDPASGVISAFLAGGGNVWISGADYGSQSLGLFGGVHIYGSFDASFAPELRSSADHPTVLRGLSGAPILASLAGTGTAVADGLVLEGDGVAQIGVDAKDLALELRDVVIRACKDRGVRLRNTDPGETLEVRLCLVSSSDNGADGLSLAGAYELAVDASAFESNVQEGIDLNDLVAPAGGTARLALRDVLLAANGTDGLDATLIAPAGGGAGGNFAVSLDGCRAELNGGEGLFVDVDFELTPAWDLSLAIQGTRARSNGLNGIHLDLDDECDALIASSVVSANRGDGLLVSSESAGGFVLLASSILAGNQGAGARAIGGEFTVCASQCVFTGNAEGGLASAVADVRAAGSIAWLQSAAWPAASAGVDVPAGAATPFVRAPEGWLTALAMSASGISYSGSALPFAGAGLEIDDDGTPRVIVSAGAELSVDPAPASLAAPAVLALFADAATVAEDWQLAAGSAALGQGLAAAGAPAIDAGPYGVLGSGTPGLGAAVASAPFRVARVIPAPGSALPPGASLAIELLGGDVDASTLSSSTVRAVHGDGSTIALDLLLEPDGSVTASPSSGGWGSAPFALEIAGLAAEDGRPLAAPVALSFDP
jgi:hypothetical protein